MIIFGERCSESCRTMSYRILGRAASVRTTFRFGVSRSTGLRSLARISGRPMGAETARRDSALPRVYRTLGLTPVRLHGSPTRCAPVEMRVVVLSLPRRRASSSIHPPSFSLLYRERSSTRVAMGIQFSLPRNSRLEHFRRT